MSEVFEVDPSRPAEAAGALEAAVEALRRGALVVLPTETVYGIGCRPDDPAAISSLFEAKRRPRGLSLPVLAGSVRQALELAEASDVALRLARSLWPGPLTLVLPRSERSIGWALGEETRTIGVRVPGHSFSLALIERAGPLAATSANVSGSPPLSDRSGLEAAFGEMVAVYVVARADTPAPSGQSSTIVEVVGDQIRVLREGPIDAEQIAHVAARGSGMRTNRHSVH